MRLIYNGMWIGDACLRIRISEMGDDNSMTSPKFVVCACE